MPSRIEGDDHFTSKGLPSILPSKNHSLNASMSFEPSKVKSLLKRIRKEFNATPKLDNYEQRIEIP